MTPERRRRTVGLGLLLLGLALPPSAPAADIVRYVELDAVGSVRVVTDDKGKVIERHDYLPFGEECTTGPCATNPGVGAGQTKKFTGKERDAETGLDYFGARYYGSKIGRFATVDPTMTIQENLLDPQRWNRYAYGRNNPLRFVDPDGRDWLFRAAMGQQYVQQYGDRSSLSVFAEGISGDIGRAGPPFQQQMATDITIASLITLFAPQPAQEPARAPTVPYSRAQYGGSQTRSPAAQAARAAGEGQACPTCGEPQVSGTTTAPSPQHDPALVKHYYEGGGKNMTPQERAAYARSPESLNGTQCLTCQRREGAELSRYSMEQKSLLRDQQ